MKETSYNILNEHAKQGVLSSSGIASGVMPSGGKAIVKDYDLFDKSAKIAVPIDIYLSSAENLTPKSDEASKKVLHNFKMLLMACGLEERLCGKLLDAAGNGLVQDGNINLDAFSYALGQSIDFGFTQYPEKIAFFGSSGVGKTTAIAKFAFYAKATLGKKTALVTLDSYKISGARQLGRIGEILDLPVYLARSSKDLILTLKELKQMDLILIDTAGCNVQELDRVHQISSWMDNYNVTQSAKSAFIKKILLLPAGSNVFDLRKMVQEFSGLTLSGLGITKADETCYFGPCLNTVLQHDFPVNFVTSGQNMDGGIETEKDGLVNKVVNLLFRANNMQVN